jgi:hypothetical protein
MYSRLHASVAYFPAPSLVLDNRFLEVGGLIVRVLSGRCIQTMLPCPYGAALVQHDVNMH